MPLLGKGMLIVFCEVKSRDERDFNEWYNREHIDERVNLPGFHRGRRYIAVRGSPKYLATYECDSVEDLATPGYLQLLANQTPWTQAVMARFTKFNRLTTRIQVDLAHGVGGAVATVRFVPDPRARKALVAWLGEIALPKAIARPGLVGAFAVENDLEVAQAPLQAKSMDHPKADEAEWVVLLEGADAAAVGAAARATLTLAKLKPFGVTATPTIGTYKFLFGNQR
ncbi:MAG: hypothetical protein FJX11_16450 [Alphaproteobacteria bacterium]|nr:hypothetical protein [Alphaproteobacteria bacterium]